MNNLSLCSLALIPFSEHKIGWGCRIRTYACGSQSPVPYRLANPQLVILLLKLHNIQGGVSFFSEGLLSFAYQTPSPAELLNPISNNLSSGKLSALEEH